MVAFVCCFALWGASSPVPASTPSHVSISVGGPAATWKGNVTGDAPEFQLTGVISVTPVPAPACLSGTPGSYCDAETVTLFIPAATAGKKVTTTVTITWQDTSSNLDIFLVAPDGAKLASTFAAKSPAVISATTPVAGDYTVQVDGDVAGPNLSYAGKVVATAASVKTLPDQLGFAPATVVSAQFFGAEPQVTIERPVKTTIPGAIDPRRVFIDWPLSSRSNIGQLSRSIDGGDSFRLLYDPTCAPRSRPMCTTGGGGDTVNRVNRYDGVVYFGDQESLANQAFASSTDHGDSFPATRSTAVANATTAVDRQWITTVDAPGYKIITGQEIRAFFSYHNPAADEVVQGVDSNGLVIPQPVPQIPLVNQSGPSRVDTTGGPATGTLYQPYRDNNGIQLASVPVTKYQNPSSWQIRQVSSDNSNGFPWVNLDSHGNLYAVWTSNGSASGEVEYAYSLIDLPANNPKLHGVPGSVWSAPRRINPPPLDSSYFPEIVVGDPGRVAIAYMATPDFNGASDSAPTSARWYTWATMSTNATAKHPTWVTGPVSHRVVHYGTICTSGTLCVASSGDRSLLDMLDVSVDTDGRPGVVFMDNNNQLARDLTSQGQQGSPYTLFAKLVDGPSLFAGRGAVRFNTASASPSFRAAPAKNAVWPATAKGKDLSALDEIGAGLSLDGKGNLIGRMKLSDASLAGMKAALDGFNAAGATTPAAERLQYVIVFWTATDAYYLSMDSSSTGVRRFFGGKLTGADNLLNPVSPTSSFGVVYNPTTTNVTGEIAGNMLTLTGKASDFGVAAGSPVYSVTAFAMAGPSQANQNLLVPMRTVDATPPSDLVLAAPSTAAIHKKLLTSVLGLKQTRHPLAATGVGLGTETPGLILLCMAVWVWRRHLIAR